MCDDWDESAPVEIQYIPPSYIRPSSNSDSWAQPEQNSYQQHDRGNRRSNDGYNGRDNRDRGGRDNRDRGGRDNRDRDGRNGGFSKDKMEILKIPSSFVGRVIGRGGAKISDLQYNSGARIQVTKETDGDSTIIKIFGSDDTIGKAKELILELTTEKRDTAPPPRQTEWPAPSPRQTEWTAPQEDPPIKKDWQTWLKESEQQEAIKWASYPPIKKDFYVEHPDVTNMSEQEVEQFRAENNNIVVDRTFKTADSKPIPKPVKTFYQAFHNYPEIIEEIRKAGFEKPSPIQCQAWPVLLNGEDLIGIAQTGTGKTLAFLLPALIHIDGQGVSRDSRGGPAVLIMAPTRELALQIDREIKKYKYKDIKSVCLYGGGSRKDQVKVVTDGVDIVIATPGRLNDIVAAEQMDVKTVTYVVLDEADRMLDMGFEPQIRKIMYTIRPNRHTVMTSATWPIGVRRLADSYMQDPVQVYVGSLDLAAVHTVTQTIMLIQDSDEGKMQTFMEFAQNLGPDQKVIVFCGKKARADDLAAEISLMRIRCQTLHGDREQSDREQALRDITTGAVQILIATDVASRGLDIEDITHVINYDFPRNIEEYVHRVGRTGRAGRYGESISYFTRQDWGQAKELISILEEAQQYVPDELYNMAERFAVWKERKDAEKARGGGGGGYRGGGGNRWH